MSDTTDLVTWLSGVLDEDEWLARVASPWPWHANREGNEVMAVDGERVADGFVLSGNQLRNTVAHIVRHDPAAVLVDIAAKRQVLRLWTRYEAKADAHRKALAELEADIEAENRTGVWSGPGSPDVRQRALRREEDMLGSERNDLFRVIHILASAYADRPGYRAEWAP